eukprot:m.406172 g.406172  ORF g.406172 m.406172 type:complete len:329 (-) comp28434_c0_seq2:1559-2545(-)
MPMLRRSHSRRVTASLAQRTGRRCRGKPASPTAPNLRPMISRRRRRQSFKIRARTRRFWGLPLRPRIFTTGVPRSRQGSAPISGGPTQCRHRRQQRPRPRPRPRPPRQSQWKWRKSRWGLPQRPRISTTAAPQSKPGSAPTSGPLSLWTMRRRHRHPRIRSPNPRTSLHPSQSPNLSRLRTFTTVARLSKGGSAQTSGLPSPTRQHRRRRPRKRMQRRRCSHAPSPRPKRGLCHRSRPNRQPRSPTTLKRLMTFTTLAKRPSRRALPPMVPTWMKTLMSTHSLNAFSTLSLYAHTLAGAVSRAPFFSLIEEVKYSWNTHVGLLDGCGT